MPSIPPECSSVASFSTASWTCGFCIWNWTGVNWVQVGDTQCTSPCDCQQPNEFFTQDLLKTKRLATGMCIAFPCAVFVPTPIPTLGHYP